MCRGGANSLSLVIIVRSHGLPSWQYVSGEKIVKILCDFSLFCELKLKVQFFSEIYISWHVFLNRKDAVMILSIYTFVLDTGIH